MTACQNSSYMVSSATENDQLIPLRRPSQASTLMSPTGRSVPRIDPCGAVWFIPEQEQQKQIGSPARLTHAPSVEECCRPELDWLATSAPTGSTKYDIIIFIEEVMVIIGNDGRTTTKKIFFNCFFTGHAYFNPELLIVPYALRILQHYYIEFH